MITVTYESLKQLRKLHRYSRRALSIASGISQSHIASIERGDKQPTMLVVCRLAHAIGVKPEELYQCEVS